MKHYLKHFHSGRAVFYMMIVICCILGSAVLKIASGVFLPLTISILLSFVMYPLVRWLNKYKIPNLISILIVVIILVAGLYVFAMVIFTTGSNIMSVYPKYEGRITEIYIWVSQFFDLSYDESISIWKNIWGQLGIRTWVRSFAFSFSNIFINFSSTAVVVILFIVFILFEASFFKIRLAAAFDKRSERINRIGYDLAAQVTRYLTAKFFISLANGIIFAVAFYFIGLEFAIIWGIIQFILNFIPSLGSITAGVVISLFAFVQFWPDPTPVILVIVVILGVNVILCNIFDPKIVGDHVGLSPLMILISLTIWGWLWGFAGMVLAVPMTVIIKIICENIPMAESVPYLIGSRKSVKAKMLEQEEAVQNELNKEKRIVNSDQCLD